MIEGNYINEIRDNCQGLNALQWACINDRIEVIEYLISQGADTNIQCGLHTPLQLAVQFGHIYTIDLLLKNDAKWKHYDRESLLIAAVKNSSPLLVLYILLFVVSLELEDINMCDENGRSPLMLASAHGDLLIIKLLLKFGSNVNLVDNDGYNAAHFAIIGGEFRIFDILIENGTDVLSKTKNGKSCLQLATEMNTVTRLQNIFRNHCLDVYKR